MLSPSRRAFLGTSLASLAGPLFAADPPSVPAPDDPPFQPSTLFLTWHRDPTTTMTIRPTRWAHHSRRWKSGSWANWRSPTRANSPIGSRLAQTPCRHGPS